MGHVQRRRHACVLMKLRSRIWCCPSASQAFACAARFLPAPSLGRRVVPCASVCCDEHHPLPSAPLHSPRPCRPPRPSPLPQIWLRLLSPQQHQHALSLGLLALLQPVCDAFPPACSGVPLHTGTPGPGCERLRLCLRGSHHPRPDPVAWLAIARQGRRV